MRKGTKRVRKYEYEYNYVDLTELLSRSASFVGTKSASNKSRLIGTQTRTRTQLPLAMPRCIKQLHL